MNFLCVCILFKVYGKGNWYYGCQDGKPIDEGFSDFVYNSVDGFFDTIYNRILNINPNSQASMGIKKSNDITIFFWLKYITVFVLI